MKKGFTLIQMSIILTLAALAMVAVLPGYQTTNNANSLSASKMNALMSALRAYEVAHGNLPCPADPTIATGNGSYGTAAANGGSTGNCMGGSPAAAYADTTKNIAVGMVPVRTLGLSYDAALDGYGRDITYVVDTNSTGCWATSTLQGAVSVTDNGIYANTVVALVSHGADAYGAWLPTQGTGSTGTGQRLNNGSTDTSEAANAEVATGGGLTALTSGNFVSLINRPATSTFDDLVVYKNCFYTLNSLPVNNANATLSTTPANGTYSSGQTLTFTLTFPQTITVTGTPELKLTANSGSGSTSIGSSPYNAGYATYSSGSSTTTLTFSYTVLSTDNAPGGITVTAPIILNGGTISSIASLCLIGKNLPNVILSNSSIYIADGSNNRVVKVTTAGGYLMGFGAGYNGIGGSMGSSGSTNGKLSYAVGIVLDSSGNIWTVDNGNSRIIEYSNSGGFTKNITNSLNDPANMAIDTTGVLWIADEGNNKLQNYNTNTSTWGTAISLGAGYYPYGVAIDKNNNSVIWTISPGNNKCALERCVVGGSCTTVSSGCGTTGGKFSNNSVFGQNNTQDSDMIAIDSSGNVWVSDETNNRIQEFSGTSPYSYIGNFTTLSGSGSPTGLFFDSNGYLWAADENSSPKAYQYQVNTSNGTATATGVTIGSGSAGIGTGTTPVELNGPQGIFIPSSR